MSIEDAGAVGNGFSCYTTILALKVLILIRSSLAIISFMDVALIALHLDLLSILSYCL